MAKKETLTVRELLSRFTKVTEEVRKTDQGMRPVHSVYTRYEGINFLDLIQEYYSCSKDDAIKKIRMSDIQQIPAKGGYLLFLEKRARKAENKKKDVIKNILNV